MIVQLHPSTTEAQRHDLVARYDGFPIQENGHWLVVTSSQHKAPAAEFEPLVAKTWTFRTDMQLSSRDFRPETREVVVNDRVRFGGPRPHTVFMTGPCSVESEAQIRQMAELCVELGVRVLRAGAYKPRTSPYSFQGLEEAGLKLLARMRDDYGLAIITEVRDATQVEAVLEHADVVQVGAKAMYDQGILRKLATTQKPVLIKRGFGSTLQETVQAAEFVLAGGNPNVMLCERGLRNFEPYTRFSLDLSGATWIKTFCNLPLVLDPSHGVGHRWGVPDLARASAALGCDGLLIEAHPDPDNAWSDAAQQLNPAQLRALHASLGPVCQAVGRPLE